MDALLVELEFAVISGVKHGVKRGVKRGAKHGVKHGVAACDKAGCEKDFVFFD